MRYHQCGAVLPLVSHFAAVVACRLHAALTLSCGLPLSCCCCCHAIGHCHASQPLLCCIASVNVCFHLIACLSTALPRVLVVLPRGLVTCLLCVVCICVCIYAYCDHISHAWCSTDRPVAICFTSLAPLPACFLHELLGFHDTCCSPLAQHAICSALRAVYLPAL